MKNDNEKKSEYEIKIENYSDYSSNNNEENILKINTIKDNDNYNDEDKQKKIESVHGILKKSIIKPKELNTNILEIKNQDLPKMSTLKDEKKYSILTFNNYLDGNSNRVLNANSKEEKKEDKSEFEKEIVDLKNLKEFFNYFKMKKKKRKFYRASGFEIFKIFYCENYINNANKKTNIIKETVKFVEQNLDITKILNIYRELNQMKYLFLEEKQKALYCLQTINIDDDKNCISSLNSEEFENNEDYYNFRQEYYDDLNEFQEECYQELDYGFEINRGVFKNFMKSSI